MQNNNVLKFTKEIYNKESIEETIGDYKEHCDMKLSENEDYFLLEVLNYDKTDEEFIDEVRNYVLEGCL